MNTSDIRELRSIIDKQLDNHTMGELEVARLEKLLQNNTHMEFYLKSMELEAHMQEGVETAEIKDLVLYGNQPRAHWRWLATTVAVAACLAFAAGWMMKTPAPVSLGEITSIPETHTESEADSPHAMITGMIGVRWSQEHDAILAKNKIDLESGLIELTYQSGVQIVIEGPAHYTITGDQHGMLEYGKLVANVPKGAEGFTVDYPMGKVVDLGTEFGVDLPKNGDLSVGVFKGKVELHSKGSKHVALIEENDALKQTVATPDVLTSIPFDRDSFVRQVPSREFSWAITSSGETERVFDVSHLIWKPSDYRAVIKWMNGKNPINITHASLWRDDQLISENVHHGIAGLLATHKTHQNIYNLRVQKNDYQKGRWTLKVKLSPILMANQGSINTQGILLLEEGLAYKATAADFIGRWQYTYDGSTWERRVLKGGKIELYDNGQLKPGFQKSHWLVEDGVMKVWIPHRNAFEDHMLRDAKTMIFIDEPYRNATKVDSP